MTHRETWDISAGSYRDLDKQLSSFYDVDEIWYHGDFYYEQRGEFVYDVLVYWDGDEEHFIAENISIYGHGPSGAVGCYTDDLPSKEMVAALVDAIEAGQFPPGDVSQCERCKGWIDHREVSSFWKSSNDRFWCHDCYDPLEKVDRVEALHEDLADLVRNRTNPDGLSNEFHDDLDHVLSVLKAAISRERVLHEQQAGFDADVIEGGETA